MIALNEIEQQTLLLHLFMHLFIWVGHEPVLANHHRLDLAPQSPRRDLRKTAFLRHLYIKTIILPRQAQDKHRENSKKDAVFRTVPVAAAHFIVPIVVIVMKVCRKNGQRPFQVTSEKR